MKRIISVRDLENEIYTVYDDAKPYVEPRGYILVYPNFSGLIEVHINGNHDLRRELRTYLNSLVTINITIKVCKLTWWEKLTLWSLKIRQHGGA